LIIESDDCMSTENVYDYLDNDFNLNELNGQLKIIASKLTKKGYDILGASEVSHEDEYPRLYIAIREDVQLLDEVLDISEEFDIQIFREIEYQEEAVVFIERHFKGENYNKEELNKKQEELLNELNSWI